MKLRPYLVPAALALLLLVLQGHLWFGRGSLPDVGDLRSQLSALEEDNAALHLRNEQITSELRDLKEGLEVIEAYARKELGMVKSNEIFVQYAKPTNPNTVDPAAARSSDQTPSTGP